MRFNFFGNDDDEDEEEGVELGFSLTGRSKRKGRGEDSGDSLGSGLDIDMTLNDEYHETEDEVTGGQKGREDEKVRWRVTRATSSYSSNAPAKTDKSARQGYYVDASSAAEAKRKVRANQGFSKDTALEAEEWFRHREGGYGDW